MISGQPASGLSTFQRSLPCRCICVFAYYGVFERDGRSLYSFFDLAFSVASRGAL